MAVVGVGFWSLELSASASIDREDKWRLSRVKGLAGQFKTGLRMIGRYRQLALKSIVFKANCFRSKS